MSLIFDVQVGDVKMGGGGGGGGGGEGEGSEYHTSSCSHNAASLFF